MSSAPGVVIREAMSADARAIAQVHVASWRWAYRDDLPAEVLDALSVDDREREWIGWLATDARSGTLVALEGSRLVGFCSFGACRDDDVTTERTAEILTLYLLESASGRGIGRELFASSLDRLRELGYARATLWVMASNDRSRRFYERAGWSWDGTTSAHRFDCANVPIVRYSTDL